MPEDSSQHFRAFATSLENLIGPYSKMSPKEAETLQRSQVETLVALEREWREAVVRHRYGRRVYEAFVDHITQERRNILSARPYFRERQQVFMKGIAPALRQRAWRKLAKFDVNWEFVTFAMGAAKWAPKSRVSQLERKIKALRQLVALINMPLAISRVRIFWSRTQKSHLSFMDMISIAVEGLHSAIDKFCLPYSKVFCSVIIGRCVGNLIQGYSETTLHFYPSDRRKLYRAHKFLNSKQAQDPDALVKSVNKDVPRGQHATAEEIQALVLAASTVSTDSKPPAQAEETDLKKDTLTGRAAPDDTRPDVRMENAEASAVMLAAAARLPLFDRKLLRLKGVNVPLTSKPT